VLPRGARFFGKAQWVATEKVSRHMTQHGLCQTLAYSRVQPPLGQVHGANFCFILSRGGPDGDGAVEVKCGKRQEVLWEDEDFFGHGLLLAHLWPQVVELFVQIERQQQMLASYVVGLTGGSKGGKQVSLAPVLLQPLSIKRVLLFGELCGRQYPHPNVPPDPRVEAVQTGVYYSPTIEFYAFGIALELRDQINKATGDSFFFLDFDKVGDGSIIGKQGAEIQEGRD